MPVIRPGLQRGDLPFHDIREFGSIETSDHTSLFQAAFDEAPIGSTLFVPNRSYTVGGTGQILTMSRHLNILSDGAAILANVGSSTTDVLYINVTDAGAAGDVRGMTIAGLHMYFNGGDGRHLILMHAAGTGALAQLNPEISSCVLIGGAANGAALFIAGEVHSARVMKCPAISNGIEFGVYAGSDPPADANRVEENLIFGTRTGVKMTAQYGSFSHTIQRNVIVSRDGAIELTDISQVKIRDNQFEQNGGTNANTYNATVIIQGPNEICESIEVTGNNFGGGADVELNLALSNAQHCIIERNDFNKANGPYDIQFLTSTTSYNRVGYNRPRGTRGVFKPTNLVVADSGEGNYGIWKFISSYGLSNSWLSDGFFYKSVDGKVTIEATFTAGVTTAGTLMFTLPVGARPVDAMRVGVETSSGAGHVLVGTNGQVTVGSLPSNTVYFNGFTFLAWHEV